MMNICVLFWVCGGGWGEGGRVDVEEVMKSGEAGFLRTTNRRVKRINRYNR